MRVLVAAGRLGDHDGVDAAVLIGRAWHAVGADVAALGLAEAGPDWARAHDELGGNDDDLYLPVVGVEADAMLQTLAVLGVTGLPQHWSPGLDPAGFDVRAAVTMVSRLVARRGRLIGLSLAGQELQPLTGPLGMAGRRADLGLAERLGYDRALEEWAQSLRKAVEEAWPGPGGPDSGGATAAPLFTEGDEGFLPGRVPGSGAGGGAGCVIQAFGGRVRSGIEVLAEQARLEQSVANADLVVTSCDNFDVDHWGSPVTNFVTELANEKGCPVVVITRTNHTNEIGQRSVGVEAVHAIGDAAEVTAACAGFARTWIW